MTDGPRYAEIDRRADLTPEAFERDYRAKGRPVVVCGPALDPWRRRWSLEELRTRFGTRTVPAVGNVHNRLIPEFFDRPLSEVIDSILEGSPRYRLRLSNLLEIVPELRAEIGDDSLFDRMFRAKRLDLILWLAPRGNRSTFHHDVNMDNLNVQICGRKRFILVPPDQYTTLYPVGFSRSPVDPFRPDHAKHPRFAEARPVECTIGDGEAVYIPRFWWHCVEALDASININSFALHGSTRSAFQDLRNTPLIPRLAMTYSSFVSHNTKHSDERSALQRITTAVIWAVSRVRP